MTSKRPFATRTRTIAMAAVAIAFAVFAIVAFLTYDANRPQTFDGAPPPASAN